jgi:tetratricopeptide (TPR) repeat protein
MARFLRFVPVAVIGLFLAVGPALAAGGGETSSVSDANFSKARKLVDKGQYADAIPLLKKVVGKDPRNADAYNYLGYSHRKLGGFDDALKYYRTALKIKPKHLGANEYLGELYLEMGKVDMAEERLAVLDKACFFGCEEYEDLKGAIDDYKARQGS